MVARISHSNIAITGDRQPLGPIEGVCCCVYKGQEGATAVKHLSIHKDIGEIWRQVKHIITFAKSINI